MNDQEDLKIARSVLITEAESILKAAERFDPTFKKAIDILDAPNCKIIVTGIGKSGHLGKKISATLCSTGSPSCFLHPAEAVHGDLGIHQKGDPVIFLSNSGSTPELLSLAPVLRKRNAQIVGILGKVESKLAEKVDIALDASVTIEADPLGLVPTASTAVAASLGDAIASALMKRKNFSENDYAITHPAGQLGRNLILKVEDVMHKPNKIACVMEKTSIGTVLPLDAGWSDVGSWKSLWEISDKDDNGNVVLGDVVLRSTSNSFLRSEEIVSALLNFFFSSAIICFKTLGVNLFWVDI